MTTRRFGISSHLFHDQRLGAEHLQEIARFGFDSFELFATRSHFDYHVQERIDDLGAWLVAANLTLHAIHAPVAESFVAGKWSGIFSIGTADEAARLRAVQETTRALDVARRIPTDLLVLHPGVPAAHAVPGENSRDAVARSVKEIAQAAGPLGVRLALEVIPNGLSSAASLVDMLEEDLDELDAGICLDFGHARLAGDPVDAVEAASGYLITTHVHDNDGRRDDHRVPFDGAIDWAGTLTATMKIGYDGAFIFEVGAAAPPRSVLERTARARQRFEEILGD